MQIKGLQKIIKDLKEMQEDLEEKMNDINWDKSGADEKDEKLNDGWMELDQAIDILKGIKDI